MKIKTGDNVMIRAGRDRGKTGKVVQVFPSQKRVVVEGINMRKRHLRPSKQGEGGQVVEFSAPIQAANLALICAKCGKPARFGVQIVKEPSGATKKLRVCKKCKEVAA